MDLSGEQCLLLGTYDQELLCYKQTESGAKDGETDWVLAWRRSLPAVPVLHWDPATWPPHAVLLLIGPNDDLSDEAHFVSLYLGLLEVGGRVC